VDASTWQNYQGGIMQTTSCSSDPSQADHAIVLVGWNTDSSGAKYWIGKNQWGDTNWGDAGYIYFQFGQNICGLANTAIVVTIPTQNH